MRGLQKFCLGTITLPGMVRDNYKSGGGSSISLKPFRSFGTKLYEMVNDPSTDSIVSWSENGNSFIVWNQSELCSDVLTKFSLSNILSIFTAKLGRFGFRKFVESEQFEYANDHFVRGRPDLLVEIQKRYIASLPPDAFIFKRRAEAARIDARTRALRLAMDQRALVNNLTNLTL